jgi:hypothetical protein
MSQVCVNVYILEDGCDTEMLSGQFYRFSDPAFRLVIAFKIFMYNYIYVLRRINQRHVEPLATNGTTKKE